MKRWFYRVRYYVSDAWDESRHSPWINLLAVATLTASLFVCAVVMLIAGNVERRLAPLRGDVRLEVYLRDDHDPGERQQMMAELEGMARVARVEFVDKAEALRRYRSWSADMAELVNELDDNPLPASLEVYLDPGTGAADTAGGIASTFEGRTAVEDVRFNQQWFERLESASDVARVGGSTLVVLVFAAVIFVMASVLRLAVYARQDEIDIMLLVGATKSFIRGPFLVAGAVQGLLASAVTLLLIEGLRRAALGYVGSGSVVVRELLATYPLSVTQGMALVSAGLFVSVTGAWFAVRRGV